MLYSTIEGISGWRNTNFLHKFFLLLFFFNFFVWIIHMVLWQSLSTLEFLSYTTIMLCCCREYQVFYTAARAALPKSISEVTGCKKPCRYRRYSYFGEPVINKQIKSDQFLFSMVALSKDTRVETEQLIYPLSSLVAEFGGTLGQCF